MYYQIYGIVAKSGHNVLIGNARTRKKTFEIVQGMNPLLYPHFAIIEKLTRCSIELGMLSGVTREGWANCDTLLVIPAPGKDYINSPKDGAAFWENRFNAKGE